MGGFRFEEARSYCDGVDRSPTEVAALWLADRQGPVPATGADAVVFLVEAFGLDEDTAVSAVGLIDGINAAVENEPAPKAKASRKKADKPTPETEQETPAEQETPETVAADESEVDETDGDADVEVDGNAPIGSDDDQEG